MSDQMRKRIEAAEQRRAARAGENNVSLEVVPRYLTADQRQAWRREMAEDRLSVFMLHIMPWPPRSPRDVSELMEIPGMTQRNLLESVRILNNPNAEAVVTGWSQRNV